MNTRRSSRSWRWVIVLIGLVACAVLALAFFRGGVGSAASRLFTPILSVRAWFWESPSGLPAYLRRQTALGEEIATLQEQLRERAGDALVTRQLRAENEALGALLGTKREADIFAAVLARPNQLPYDTLLIDRGAQEGIVEGATVFVRGGIAVGVIVAVYPHSALVRLVTAPNTEVTAYIVGADIFTRAEGMGGGVMRVTVPQGVPLAVGDMVVLPAAGTGVYGEVVAVEALESSPQQYGYVTSPVPLQEVRFVSVAPAVSPSLSYEDARAVVAGVRATLFPVILPEESAVETERSAIGTTTTE